jgi:serine protease inhibitor
MKFTRALALGVVVAVAVGAYVLTKRADALPFAGRPTPTDEQRAAAKDVTAAINDFAFKLAHQVAKERKSGNMLISPLSVSTAHSMLLAGTTGNAKKELAGVLGYGKLNDDAIHGGMFALNYEAQRAEGGQFNAANAFMMLDKRPIKDAFRKLLKEDYDAEFRTLPGASSESLKQINDWVRTHTDGMIPKVLDRFPDQAVFVLMNASAFAAKWEKEFDPADTRDDAFKTGDGKEKQVPMMNLHEAEVLAQFHDDYEVTSAELPYKGKEFGMVVLLPPAGTSVWQYLAGLDGPKWSQIVSKLKPNEIDVVLPKFTFDDGFDLVSLLQPMGAKGVFVGGGLLGISNEMPETMVAVDIHKTHIEVDEKGTRAAAVTAAVTTDAASMPFRVDRAFVYAIVHKPSGVIVFLGVCSDPTVER